MGKVTGFLEFKRELPERRKVELRVLDYKEFEGKHGEDRLKAQAARCMDCGIPFCQSGCPLGNIIPDWNDLVYRGRWQEAIERLHSTNNFPEFTGWVCPAPCEEACVLNLRREPVTIKQIEKQIVDHAFSQGWIAPRPAAQKTGKRVAVVGSGPAGLAAAQQLARAGHDVTVFERAPRAGGLLRFGIPDFKMEKHRIDRRIAQMEAEGVVFRCGVEVGRDLPGHALRASFDAVLLAMGSTMPRDLPVPGRALQGVHFAMEYLSQQNAVVAGDPVEGPRISAEGKHVVVIGGGDTGSDCVGTANRQRAASVTQLELLPRPPDARTEDMPWPYWPMIFRVSSSHEEGAARMFSIQTRRFEGDDEGRVKKLVAAEVEWRTDPSGRRVPVEVEGSEQSLDADLVLLAMGFVGVGNGAVLDELGVERGPNGAVRAQGYATSAPGVFAAGDARRGQSLVVWAIWEGREAAREVDAWLRGRTDLPSSPLG